MTTSKSLSGAAWRRLPCVAAAVLAAGVAFAQQRAGQIHIRTVDVGGVPLKYHIQGDSAIIGTGNGGAPVVPAGTEGRLALPAEIDGFKVRRIGPFAFSGCSRLEEVALPDRANGQLGLSQGLFSGCRSLRRVVFPERFFLSSWGGRPGSAADILHGCLALEEVVFLGGVPESAFMERLGVPLDNRLRFTENYAKQWKIYAEDNGISGWKIVEPPAEGGGRPERAADARVDLSLAEYSSDNPDFAPLAKLASDLSAYLKSVGGQYEESHRKLMAQRLEQMRKNKAKSQAAGDLDAVMAYEEAMKTDGAIETEVESLKALYAQCAAAEAAYRKERDEKQAKAAATVAAKIEEIKVRETKAGNIAYAKEAKTYGDRVAALSEALQRRVKSADTASAPQEGGKAASDGKAAAGGGADREPSEPLKGRIAFQGATAMNISVGAADDKGSLIGGGNFDKGDLLVVQYTGGTMSRYSGGADSFNPDRRDHYYFREDESASTARISGPDKARNQTVRQLPYGTEQSPYVFEVPETGRYRLTCFLGRYATGKASYQVLRVTKFNAQRFKSSPQARQCQW